MNPLVQEAIGAILRHFLTILAGYLVARGIWTGERAEMYVTAAVAGIIALAWSLYQKYGSRIKLLIALGLAHPTTEADVQQRAKNTNVSVATPKDEVPKK